MHPREASKDEAAKEEIYKMFRSDSTVRPPALRPHAHS